MIESMREEPESLEARANAGDSESTDESQPSSSPPKPRQIGPPRKLYKIGEVMRYSGLTRQTIHNYTMLGLITEEERTPSGHRLYGEGVFHRLQKIQDLKERMSLKEIRDALERGEA